MTQGEMDSVASDFTTASAAEFKTTVDNLYVEVVETTNGRRRLLQTYAYSYLISANAISYEAYGGMDASLDEEQQALLEASINDSVETRTGRRPRARFNRQKHKWEPSLQLAVKLARAAATNARGATAESITAAANAAAAAYTSTEDLKAAVIAGIAASDAVLFGASTQLAAKAGGAASSAALVASKGEGATVHTHTHTHIHTSHSHHHHHHHHHHQHQNHHHHHHHHQHQHHHHQHHQHHQYHHHHHHHHRLLQSRLLVVLLVMPSLLARA
jgi:hypothetical protein